MQPLVSGCLFLTKQFAEFMLQSYLLKIKIFQQCIKCRVSLEDRTKSTGFSSLLSGASNGCFSTKFSLRSNGSPCPTIKSVETNCVKMQSYSPSILYGFEDTEPICLLSLSVIRLVLQCTGCCQSNLTHEGTLYKFGRKLP